MIQDLGNGVGQLYIVDPDGTSIQKNLPNNEIGSLIVKAEAAQSIAAALGQRAVGSIQFNAPTGVGTFTQLTINAINQMTGTIPYTGATTANALAVLVAAEVNSTTALGGFDYTAVVVVDTVYLLVDKSAGDSVNGDVVVGSATGNLTFTETDVAGGSDSEQVYDERSGYRFFINSSSGATTGTLVGATEITNYLINRGLNSAIDEQDVTIASGVITFTRKTFRTVLNVDTEGAAATDDLTDISIVGMVDGDQVVLVGANAARVTTVKSTGNITLQGATDFDTGDGANAITLRFNGGRFYEENRTTQQIGTESEFRAAGYPFGPWGNDNLIVADNTTETLVPGTEKTNQTVAGTVTLTTGNYEVVFDTTGAVNGTRFKVKYDANITKGVFDVIIGGRTLSSQEALSGGLIVEGEYSATDGFYIVSTYADFNGGYQAETVDYADNSVTADKVEDNLTYEAVTLPVSFESGEQCDNRIEMPYDGTVSKVTAVVTKAIAATDVATITPKNGAGVNMTSGGISFSAGDPLETTITSSPTGNNTFVAGDIIRFTSAKATAGGKALLSVYVTRT